MFLKVFLATIIALSFYSNCDAVRADERLPSAEISNGGRFDFGVNIEPNINYHKKKVEIFVTSWCAYCKQLEQFLRENHIKYKKYDVERDSYGYQVYRQLGGGVPITKIDNRILRGFSTDALEQALAEN